LGFQEICAFELNTKFLQSTRDEGNYISCCVVVFDILCQREFAIADDRSARRLLAQSMEWFPEFLLPSLNAAFSDHLAELAMARHGS
jgi:hypothetical protein